MPTSFSGCPYLVLQPNYDIMMFSANRGTPQYDSPFNQIKAVTHIFVYYTHTYIYLLFIFAQET